MVIEVRSGSEIPRRVFLQRGGLATAGLAFGGGSAIEAVLAACGGAPAPSTSPKATTNVVYAGFGGVYEQGIKQGVLMPFQQQTSVQVDITADGSDVAKISASVRSGHTQWDVVDATGPSFGQFLSQNLLQKLDFSIVKTSDLASPKYVDPYGVGVFVYSHNIWWNKKAIPGPLTTWADVWNVQKFPGKRGFVNLPWYTLEISLLADGVPMSKLYPLDVDRAFRSLDKIKGHASFLPLNTLTNLVSQQEIVTGDLNLARVQKIMHDGIPLTYTWQQTLLDLERWPILKGAANYVNANKLISFLLQPEQQFQVLKILGYSPATKKAIAQINPEQAKDLPGTPATAPTSFYLDPEWWAKHGPAVQKRFQDWLLTAQ